VSDYDAGVFVETSLQAYLGDHGYSIPAPVKIASGRKPS
jgi:hypothetical protein